MENKRRCLAIAGREGSRRAGERCTEVPVGMTSIDDLTDGLLELVFLRLSFLPSSLVRATAACKRWRRLIASDGFLRRFRSFHPPQVHGHYNACNNPVFIPSPAPPLLGEAAIEVRDRLSFNFLPSLRKHMLTDRRGPLLAFVSGSDLSIVIVCNPWTGQHREILPSTMEEGHSPCLGAFLLAADETAGTSIPDMSNFRVLCLRFVQDEENFTTTFQASVFSARDGRSILLRSTAVDNDIAFPFQMSMWKELYKGCVGRTGSSLFLYMRGGDNILQVNEITGALSALTLPHDPDEFYAIDRGRWKLRVVAGGDDDGTRALRIARIVGADIEVLRFDGEEFVLDKKVGLAELCDVAVEPGQASAWHFVETGGDAVARPGCVVLSPSKRCKWMFCVDVESMEAQRVRKRNAHDRPGFSYELPWPPTIKACL